jgi:hypothetical protein
MNTKQSLIIGTMVIFGCLILGLSFGNLATGQVTTPPPVAGPYQISLKAMDSNTVVFVFDSKSGRCWYRDTAQSGASWTDLGSPLQPDK